MNAKLWILVFGTAFVVFIFHHALRAEEAPTSATNVFLDEGEADYEMPKLDGDKAADAMDTKVTSKKSKKKDVKNPRVPANDEDDDKSATGTKGDAFDQMQNPEASQAPSNEKKAPAKAVKKSEDLSQKELPKKTIIANKPDPSTQEVVAPAQMTIQMKPTKGSTNRVPASSSFKQGFKTTKDGDCAMYADADKTSAQVLVVKGAKKLWVEQSGDFFKAYHKKGSGYLPAECFE